MRHVHGNAETLAADLRTKLSELHQSTNVLTDKKVLIVDDDTRNIFALASVLEEQNMVVSSADNGRDAINILQDEPDIDIVLMDIMMPDMDGIETIREIRKVARLKNLPIVAVTAKAMKGDREKCLEAGAWDYLSKPVDTEQMISVLRGWLHR
jgi:CheY-like chemotaxis protein